MEITGQYFTGRMPFLSSEHQRQDSEGIMGSICCVIKPTSNWFVEITNITIGYEMRSEAGGQPLVADLEERAPDGRVI